MTYQRCNNCNGSGTILNHQHYSHSGQRSAGQGMSVCPSCNGSGHNGALDLSSNKYNGKSPSEIQGEKIGEGCVTVIFPIIPYLIVLFAISKLVDFLITIIPDTDYFTVPEWLPATMVVVFFGIILFFKKYIGRIAILSVAILAGSSYLFNNEKNNSVAQTTPVQSKVLLASPKKAPPVSMSKANPKKSTLIEQCQSCSKILNFKGKLPASIASIREGKRKYCESFKRQCINKGYKW